MFCRFQRIVPGAFNVGLIGSTCTALPGQAARSGRRPRAPGRRSHPAGPLAYSFVSSTQRLRSLTLSVTLTIQGHFLEVEGLLTQGSRPGRTVGGSVGEIFEMDCSDWSNGIQYQIFDTGPDTGLTRVSDPDPGQMTLICII